MKSYPPFYPQAVYIHCSSGNSTADQQRAYARLVQREIDFFQPGLGAMQSLKALYFGGTSDLVISKEWILDMSGKLKDRFSFDKDIQITVEVAHISHDIIAHYSKGPINRLCIATDEMVIAKMTSQDNSPNIFKLIERACCLFSWVTLDVDLSGVGVSRWQPVCKKLFSLPIDSFSITFTKSFLMTERIIQFFKWLGHQCRLYEFEQHELLNYVRKGSSISNYMKVYGGGLPYKGFGLGSITFDGTVRATNHTDYALYAQAVADNRMPYGHTQMLSPQELRIEKIITSLRQKAGLSLEILYEGLTYEQKKKIRDKSTILVHQGLLLTVGDEVIRLTPAGMIYEMEVLTWLMG